MLYVLFKQIYRVSYNTITIILFIIIIVIDIINNTFFYILVTLSILIAYSPSGESTFTMSPTFL